MLLKIGTRLLRRSVLSKSIVVSPSFVRTYAQKDFHAPDWDLKHQRLVDVYEDDRSWRAEFRLKNGSHRERWKYYDQVVWRPDYEYPDGEPKTGEVFHVAQNVKSSALKLFYGCQLIRGRTVDDAVKQLQFVPRKCAIVLRDMLEEAVDKAINEHGIEYRSKLWIAECYAQKTVVIKGLRRHARERWAEVEYPFSDVYMRLQEGQPPPYMGRRPAGPDGYFDGQRHLDELRSRRIKHGI